MTTAVLYHANCPDGFTAAWVAHNALKAESPTSAIPVTHGDPPPDLAGFSTIYIVDFSYPHKVLTEMADGRRLVLLDHHKSAIDEIHESATSFTSDPGADVTTIDGAYEAVLDVERSGAGITWDYFHRGKLRPELVNYVEDRDLWRYALPFSREVNSYIRTLPRDSFVEWDALDSGWDTKSIIDLGTGALSHVDAYCRAAAGHAYWCTMGDRYFPIVNVTYESCSDVAEHLLDHFDADMAGYFFERGQGGWQYGFRSRNDVTVHDHATAFGGGGHPQAAGCVGDKILHRRA